jgi:gamma-glutamylcyclotransferase (GGCT)/AIG2-like uncharacterized protein YtfP
MALMAFGAWREEDGSLPIEVLEERLDGLLGRPSRRLAVYGSLRPGQLNHWRVADLGGTWRKGTVRGDLHPEGRGRTGGWPVLVLNEEGRAVLVDVLDSEGLPARWGELDGFESSASYRRELVIVDCGGGLEVANLYTEAWPLTPGDARTRGV